MSETEQENLNEQVSTIVCTFIAGLLIGIKVM